MQALGYDEMDVKELLSEAIGNGIITLDDVRKKMAMMRRRDILKAHKYKIWQGKDGKWYTHFYDETKADHRRLVKRSTQKELENLIVNTYCEENAEDEITLTTVYPMWLQYFQLHTLKSASVKRYSTEWSRFYEGTKIATIPLKKWIGGIHMKPILNIENLTKVYGTLPNQTRALNGITFQVMPGEFLGIMGSSGSGKSTLLNCIATVIQPTGGSIQVEGDTLQSIKGKALAEYRGKKVGYLFQNFELLDNLTGRENILLPTSLHGVSEAESSQRLKQLADYLEITDVLDKFPSKMSGGQRQRVAAARALILHPQMILADEPTGALDSKNARSLMEKLSGLNRDEQATILMVTHDSNAASFCKRILFIQDGVIFHELRRGDESQQEFYGRILKVMAQLGGGSANVL